MLINGRLIQQMDVKEQVYYHLADICKALNLDLIESLSYLEQQKQTRPLLAGGDAWITQQALTWWMLVPETSRCLSPEAVAYAIDMAKKTLQAG